jgi:PAS domain S-box-containing protein
MCGQYWSPPAVLPQDGSMAKPAEGSPRGIHGSALWTHATRRNEALENAQRMTAIVENSNDAIIAKTLDGIISSWNRAAERMYGYSSEEIIGKSIEVLCPNERTGEIETILAKIRAGQHVEHLQTIRIRKDGTALPVSLTVSPIRDADGAVIGASTTTHDVTQSRQAIESGRSMIESSLDSLVAISPQGMITDVNEATVKVTGIPRAELIGTAFSDCFTEPEKANAIYQLVFEQGMAVDYPLTMRHRDGALTEVLYNASVYRDGGGKVLGVFAAARDVAKQHWAQQQVAEQQAKALERLAELENFQRLTVGRELKMIELKKQIAQLQMYGPAGGEHGDEYSGADQRPRRQPRRPDV